MHLGSKQASRKSSTALRGAVERGTASA